jgi:DNA-binding beta-propeller fold protein YncE
VAATVPVGPYPVGLAVDPATHDAYVTSHQDDTVTVISPVGGLMHRRLAPRAHRGPSDQPATTDGNPGGRLHS